MFFSPSTVQTSELSSSLSSCPHQIFAEEQCAWPTVLASRIKRHDRLVREVEREATVIPPKILARY